MTRTPTEWMIEPLRRYAQFTGRACRAEYWWFILFGTIVAVVAAVIDLALGLRHTGSGNGPVGGLTSLALFLPQLAVSIRRLHDLDRSGWWVGGVFLGAMVLGLVAGVAVINGGAPAGGTAALIGLVALALAIYSIVLLVWFCSRGTTGPNRYGDDPLAATTL